MSEVLSDIFTLKNGYNLPNIEIEKELSNVYGEVIRWAIVEADSDIIKIGVSYVKS